MTDPYRCRDCDLSYVVQSLARDCEQDHGYEQLANDPEYRELNRVRRAARRQREVKA